MTAGNAVQSLLTAFADHGWPTTPASCSGELAGGHGLRGIRLIADELEFEFWFPNTPCMSADHLMSPGLGCMSHACLLLDKSLILLVLSLCSYAGCMGNAFT